MRTTTTSSATTQAPTGDPSPNRPHVAEPTRKALGTRESSVDMVYYTSSMSIDILSGAAEQWSKVFEFLRSQSDLYVGREAECKRFIGAVFWITRTGAQWRMLPAESRQVEQRLPNGSPDGVNAVYAKRMHQHFVDDPAWRTSSLTARSSGLIIPPQAHPKKRWASITSPWSKPRWVHYKGPRERGWPRQSLEV